MLNYTETTERAAELIRMVIPRLSQVRIPINPINYALWYEYFLGRSIKLNNELDRPLKMASRRRRFKLNACFAFIF